MPDVEPKTGQLYNEQKYYLSKNSTFRSQKTSSIVLSLCQTFTMLACKLPDILIPFLHNLVNEKSLRETTAQIAAWSTVAIIINQYLQIIICIVVSAKYRESGKMVFRRSERVVRIRDFYFLFNFKK